jgi:cytidylate kinase
MDDTAPPIFWLDGMAGTGKSAIARSFCRSLHDAHRLGGSFFCLRGLDSRANVKRILPTLSWFLTRQDSQYQRTLLEILRDAPDVADYTIKRQVEFLLEMPFHHVSINQQRPPLVLAIDALDECADTEGVEQLLTKLLSVCKDLPVKVFLTSRPERHIVTHLESSQPEFHRILRLHDIEQDLVEADILKSN